MGGLQSGTGRPAAHSGDRPYAGKAALDTVCASGLRYIGDAASDQAGRRLLKGSRSGSVQALVLSLVRDVEEARRRVQALREMGVEPFVQPYRDYDGGEPAMDDPFIYGLPTYIL